MKLVWSPDQIKTRLWELDDAKTYVLSEKKNNRTLQQNNYLHAVFSDIAVETGDDPVFMKENLKSMFLKDTLVWERSSIDVVKNTSQLTKKEFSAFVESIRWFALHYLQMTIPNPEDNRIDEYLTKHWF